MEAASDVRPAMTISAPVARAAWICSAPASATILVQAARLSALISGSGYGTETGNMVDGPFPGRDSQFFVAINVAALQDIDDVRGRSDKILSQIKQSGRAAGTDRLFVPGEIEASLEAQFQDEGIPLNDETLNDLLKIAQSVGANVEQLDELVVSRTNNHPS